MNYKSSLNFRLSSDEEALRSRLRIKLKEIMLKVNLDQVTSKFVSYDQFANTKSF